jgi:hypothetical protein
MSRLEEIKNKYGGSFIIHGENTIVGDMVWLIEKLENSIHIINQVAKATDGSEDMNNRGVAQVFLKELE